MKYLVKRDRFNSGIIPVDQKPILEKSGDWKDTYDELPNWKDSAVGRLLSFITRKTVEKAQGLRINKILNDFEAALNTNVIDELSKEEDFKKAVNTTEKSSFFKGLFNKIKSSKNDKEFEKVKDTYEEVKAEEVSYVENPPVIFNILIQIIEGKFENQNKESKSSEGSENKEQTNTENKNTPSKETNKSIKKSSFIDDLLLSKNPYEFLKEPNIRKQFFIDLKMLMSSNFGSIIISYMDEKLKADLNQLSIFKKKETKNAGTEKEVKSEEGTLTDKNIQREESLKKQEELKKQRLQKQEEIKAKKTQATSEPTAPVTKKEKASQLQESVAAVDSDTLALREDSLKKLVIAIKKLLSDKRVKREDILKRFFVKTSLLYNEYLGENEESSNTSETDSKVESENNSGSEDNGDIKSLLPVLYKDLSQDEIKLAEEINDSISINGETGLIVIDQAKFKSIEDEFNSEMKSNIEESQKDVENNKELENKAEEIEKNETAIDPLEIIKVFNKMNKIMVVNYMPSNRSGGAVSRRVANDYEKLDGGAPSLQNNDGPYRNKKLFDKWNEGVLNLLKKYQERLKQNKYIIYKDDGSKEIQTSKSPITKFINDMLNDSKATGTDKDGKHQTDFLESYFNIKDEYVSQYKSKYGDPFSANTTYKTEMQTESKSASAAFSANKTDGTAVDRIIINKMRDKNAGFAFSFNGTINGYDRYEGKKATLYCLGVKTYAKDYVLVKMSFNNDWYLKAYNVGIEYNPETEDTSKNNQVFLMLMTYDSVIKNNGEITARIMPCIKAEDMASSARVYTLKISKIDSLRILQGKDGFMMKMNKYDKTKKTSKDINYAKDETFNNILSLLTKK